jgi:hypothetical protein
MNNLFNIFNIIFSDYKNNPINYNITTNTSKRLVILDQPIDDRLINNILTKEISSKFIKSNDTIIDIINLYFKIYEHAISEYIIYTKKYKIEDGCIKFVLKGDMAMLLVVKNISSNMPHMIRKSFNEMFNDILKKSTLDFEIVVDYNKINENNRLIEERNRLIEERNKQIEERNIEKKERKEKKEELEKILTSDRIFNDLYSLSFIVLKIVRDYIIINKYKFSDFEKYDTKFQKKILESIRTELNNHTPYEEQCCKIGTNNIYEEAPCPKDYGIDNDYLYDEINIINDGELTKYRPEKLGYLKFGKQYQYILMAYIKKNTFGLTSMNVFFNLYNKIDNIQQSKCCNNKKGVGKFINVYINHPQKENDFNNYTYMQINGTTYNIPTRQRLLEEHLNIFKTDIFLLRYDIYSLHFGDNPNSTDDRLKNIFCLITIELLLEYNNDIHSDIIKMLDYCTTYMNDTTSELKKNHIVFNKIEIEIDDRLTNIKNVLIELIQSIFNKDKYLFDDSYLYNFHINSNEYIKKIKTIINNYYDYINKPNIAVDTDLTNTINQLGGFVMCANTSNNILKNIIDNLQLFQKDNKIILSSIKERFYKCYEYLILNYKKKKEIKQIFSYNIDMIDGNKSLYFYKLYEDPYINEISKYDSNLNITSLIFLNYLLDYHCYLIAYNNNEFNTINNQNVDFYHIEWTPPRPIPTKDIYKDELLNKNPNELLELFCNNINVRFYRFIEVLLLKLYTNLKSFNITLDEIKEKMFEKKHYQVNDDKNSLYNFMYCTWKQRLTELIIKKYNFDYPNNIISDDQIKKYHITFINTAILDSINYCDNDYFENNFGMFNYLFNVKTEDTKINNKKHYSNCILSTLFEIYFLLRIYEDRKNVGIMIQCPDKHNHRYWIITQREINNPISHYTAVWNRLIYDKTDGTIKYEKKYFRNELTYKYSDMFMMSYDSSGSSSSTGATGSSSSSSSTGATGATGATNSTSTNDSDNMNKILQIFLYPIIDYRIEFIKHNIKDSTSSDKITELHNIVDYIKMLIETKSIKPKKTQPPKKLNVKSK